MTNQHVRHAICHLPLECPNLEGIRRKYFDVDVSSLRNLIEFESVDNQNVIDFIKKINFYKLTLMFVIHVL